MALDEAPPFWWQDRAWQAWLLSPASYIYGKVAARRMDKPATSAMPIPIICVGNFIAGGAGKTPTVQMLSRFVRSKGMRPGILTRGYGGAITTSTVVMRDKHNAHDVGDEALLHASHAITVVSQDRPKGAWLLVDQGCNIILMDDGFQNPALTKDYSLVVVDAKRGLGNGFSIPAGPMRMPLRPQLFHADALLIIGDGERGGAVIRRSAKAGKPSFVAHPKPILSRKLLDIDLVAFAGIADPSKFFQTLEKSGFRVVDTASFGDHHLYTEEECISLLRKAQQHKATLITTSKDAARLGGAGEACERLLSETEVLEINLMPEDPNMLDRILEKAMENFTARTLKSAN